MSTFRPGSRGSSSRVPSSKNTSPEKKPSLPVRVIRWTAVQIVSFILAVLILGIGYAAVTWTNIPSGSGASGQPVNQTLVQGIINNINYLSGVLAGVDTRLDTLESGQTTGGTVTGPLRWSSEYSAKNYDQAWTTCLALSPTGAWRLPIADEIETGKHINTSLFTTSGKYWSSSPINGTSSGYPGFDYTDSYGYYLVLIGNSDNWTNAISSTSNKFRCVSNS